MSEAEKVIASERNVTIAGQAARFGEVSFAAAGDRLRRVGRVVPGAPIR